MDAHGTGNCSRGSALPATAQIHVQTRHRILTHDHGAGAANRLPSWIHLDVRLGSGRPSNTLTIEQNYNINKWSWIFAPPGFLVSIIARVSIAILLVRIFGTKRWFRYYMIHFTVVQTIVGIVSIIFLVAQCKPYEGLWNKAVRYSVLLGQENLPIYGSRFTMYVIASSNHTQGPAIAVPLLTGGMTN